MRSAKNIEKIFCQDFCEIFEQESNTELYNLFSSLSAIYVAGGSGLPNGADYQILFTTGMMLTIT